MLLFYGFFGPSWPPLFFSGAELPGCCRKLREQDLQGSGGTARGWAWDVGSTTGPAGFGPFQIAAVPALSGFSLAVGVG